MTKLTDKTAEWKQAVKNVGRYQKEIAKLQNDLKTAEYNLNQASAAATNLRLEVEDALKEEIASES